MGKTIQFNSAELETSAVEARDTLLAIPMLTMQRLLPFVAVIPGINGKLVIGSINNNFELENYPAVKSSDKMTLTGRDLELFLGSMEADFDPNELYKSVFAKMASGKFEDTPMAEAILASVMKRVSNRLYHAVFSSNRDDSSKSKSKKLFYGFDTIAAKEITASKITKALGNLYEFPAAITGANACDSLMAFYRNSSDELQENDSVMFVDYDTYNAYCDDYASTHGSSNFTKGFEQITLLGSSGKCKLIPVSAKKGSSYLQLSALDNLTIGFDGEGNMDESILLEKHALYQYTFGAKLAIGCQYASIDSSMLCIGKVFNN